MAAILSCIWQSKNRQIILYLVYGRWRQQQTGILRLKSRSVAVHIGAGREVAWCRRRTAASLDELDDGGRGAGRRLRHGVRRREVGRLVVGNNGRAWASGPVTVVDKRGLVHLRQSVLASTYDTGVSHCRRPRLLSINLRFVHVVSVFDSKQNFYESKELCSKENPPCFPTQSPLSPSLSFPILPFSIPYPFPSFHTTNHFLPFHSLPFL